MAGDLGRRAARRRAREADRVHVGLPIRNTTMHPRSAPSLSGPVEVPRPGHTHVGVQREPTGAPDQQVLAARLDAIDAFPGWRIGAGRAAVSTRRSNERPARPSRAAASEAAVRWIVSPSGTPAPQPRSVSPRYPSTNPAPQPLGVGDAADGSPSMRRSSTRRRRPSFTRDASASAQDPASSERDERASAPLEERDDATVDEHDVRAGRAEAPRGPGQASAAPYGCAGSAAASTSGQGLARPPSPWPPGDGRPPPASRTAPLRGRRRSTRGAPCPASSSAFSTG